MYPYTRCLGDKSSNRYILLRRVRRNSPYLYRSLTSFKLCRSIRLKKSAMNVVHCCHSTPFGRRLNSVAIRKSLSWHTSQAYDRRKPQADLCNSTSAHKLSFQNSKLSRYCGRGFTKKRSSAHTRCSLTSSVVRIVLPNSFCRCRDRAHRGRPASQRLPWILSSFGVFNSRCRYRGRSCPSCKRVAPSLIAAGRLKNELNRLELSLNGTSKGGVYVHQLFVAQQSIENNVPLLLTPNCWLMGSQFHPFRDN